MDVAPTFDALVKTAVELFRSQFKEEPELAVFAPGRVNLIGEHTDYNDGFVFPLALERRAVIVGRVNNKDVCRVVTNVDVGSDPKYAEFSADAASLQPGEPHWANYVKGVAKQLPLKGFDAAIVSSVPLGGGLSSSASVEVASHLFIEQVSGAAVEPKQRALNCQKAEHTFAHVPCGIMDQFISVMGKDNHALLIDCRSLEARLVPIDSPDLVLLVTNSNVKHALTGSEYGTRRKQCETAAAIVAKKHPNVKALRDVTMDMLDEVKGEMEEVVYRRARHVIGECERTTKAADLLVKGEYKTVGDLMVQSHNSLRDDYEVSCEELDVLVELAMQVDGVLGSRMTGGGFGGCTVTLVQASAVERTVAHILKGYPKATIFATRPGSGASAFDVKAFL
eukprot:Colp12_sorted_trinity150504_noHs@4445